MIRFLWAPKSCIRLLGSSEMESFFSAHGLGLLCVCACRLSIYDDDDYNRIKPRERVGQWD